MSESKKTVKRAAEAEEKKYSTEKLLKSRRFAAYQPDFARVILTEPEYHRRSGKSFEGRKIIWQVEHG